MATVRKIFNMHFSPVFILGALGFIAFVLFFLNCDRFFFNKGEAVRDMDGFSLSNQFNRSCNFNVKRILCAVSSDFNGDSFPDILIADRSHLVFFICKGDEWIQSSYMPFNHYASWFDMKVVDIDNDNDYDIVFLRNNIASPDFKSNDVTDFGLFFSLNPSMGKEGMFKAWQNYKIRGHFLDAVSLDLADYDKDGNFDILLGRRNSIEVLSVWCNSHHGMLSFTLKKKFEYTFDGHSDLFVARWVDLNGDGFKDIIAGGKSLRMVFLQLKGSFRVSSNFYWPHCDNSVTALAFCDLNKDGHLDMVEGCCSSSYNPITGSVGREFGNSTNRVLFNREGRCFIPFFSKGITDVLSCTISVGCFQRGEFTYIVIGNKKTKSLGSQDSSIFSIENIYIGSAKRVFSFYRHSGQQVRSIFALNGKRQGHFRAILCNNLGGGFSNGLWLIEQRGERLIYLKARYESNKLLFYR